MLLERIDAAGVRPAAEDRNAVLASIRRNLADILNTRIGSAAAQMDLGTLPPNEILQGIPESLDKIRSSLRSCIGTYEPRLTDVDVVVLETEGDPLAVHFLVRGRLRGEGAAVSFETQVDKAGRIVLGGRS